MQDTGSRLTLLTLTTTLALSWQTMFVPLTRSATLKALLIEAVDWDSDLERLLGGATPLVDEDAAEKG
jgi:hypothetical protein